MRKLITLATLAPAMALGQVPTRLGYQGRLMNNNTPETGTQSVTFSLYSNAQGTGTPLWSETQPVGFSNGFYSVALGDATPAGCTGSQCTGIPSTVFTGSELYLQITVGTQALTPLQRVDSVAYAVMAQNLSGGTVNATSVSVNGTTVINSSGQVASTAIDVTKLQSRVTGTCSGGTAIATVNQDGTVTCSTASAGGVTSVLGAAPISSSGGASPTISIAQANGSTNGFLSSTDWTTFNGKAAGSGSANYIQNQTTTPQNAGFNISGQAAVGSATPNAKLDVTAAVAIAGPGTISSSGTTVTGVGTSFKTGSPAVLPGDVISFSGATTQSLIVASVGTDTSLVTLGSFSPAAGSSAYTISKPAANVSTSLGGVQQALFVNSLGNVGVGSLLFHIDRSDASPNAGYIRFGDNNGWKLHIGRSGEITGTAGTNTGTTGVLVTIQDDGNVGINTMTPGERLEVNGNIKFSGDNSVMSAAPRSVRSTDPRAGCPPAWAANTDFWTMPFTLTRTATVLVSGDLIRNAAGRADLLLFVDGAQVMQIITNTGATADWLGGHVQWSGTLSAGSHTASMRSPVANAWGCGGTWGSMDALIFAH